MEPWRNPLILRARSDTPLGEFGNDAYVLGRDHGSDTISESDGSSGNTDVVQFLSGIDVEQLWFRQIGKGKSLSMEVSAIGTDDKRIVDKWYTRNQYHIERFETADGHILLDSQVQA